ncbi:YggT family protein [Rugamonas sp. FT107W]|uniref:YggT family protein n=1 Tax=Duganella vulcania TaxID=2692166 RepID=A0A845GI52_9BURK|nr:MULTISPECIES: YggT family protein [Duganella]MCU6496505.1 YggT family protein [Rugamonas sp. A1-17]MYM89100.1 YggT family protein [Duganella vulcania]MYM93661.1 YggT family protein [Duganella vulcania]MYN16598.1 YggT family protein [Duganella vulcania]NVD69304.1 YggT family protein [Duganella sp. BJB1802]
MIVDAIATLLGGALLLRFWMQAIRVRPPASVAQFTFQLSDWLVRPLRRIVPGVGGYDWASLIGAFLIVLLATSVMYLAGWTTPLVLLMACQRFLQWILYGFMALLVVEAIFSWVNPHAPLAPFVRALNEPLLRPIRRVVPLVGNLDLSLLVALILLQIALLVLGMLFSGR